MTTQASQSSVLYIPAPIPAKSLVLETALNGIGFALNLIDVVAAKDLTLVPESRHSGTKRRALSSVGLVLTAGTTASYFAAASTKFNDRRLGLPPLSHSNGLLRKGAFEAGTAVLIASKSLASGKATIPHEPLSGFGRAYVAVILGSAAYRFVTISRTLYQQSPETQSRVNFAKKAVPLMAKEYTRRLKNRRNGTSDLPLSSFEREIEDLTRYIDSLSPEEIRKMLGSSPDTQL